MDKVYEKGESWPSIKRLNLFAESNQTPLHIQRAQPKMIIIQNELMSISSVSSEKHQKT